MSESLPAVYGYAVAALVYAGFGVWLLRREGEAKARRSVRWTFLLAVATSTVWASIGVAAQLLQAALLTVVQVSFDLARYSAWFLFLFALLRPRHAVSRRRALHVLVGSAGMLLVGEAFWIGLFAYDPRADLSFGLIARFNGLALPLVGLVFIEQLFRNLPYDSRWNAKPLCIGLSAIFVFDLYLYSQAVLFGRFDESAVAIRGAIHALAVPFLVVAARRETNWTDRVRVSRTAAFHTATLLLAGGYLLFISAIASYVRYFGGEWGSALQLGLLFVAAVLLSIVFFSGAMRAKLRVLLGKHFFSYRYDYRQEWLRFTATLSAFASPQDMGGQVIRGLADMLESPAGSLWAKTTGRTELCHAASWNAPRSDWAEAPDSPLCCFLRERKWIISVDEAREHPERYAPLVLSGWIMAWPQAWLVVPLIVGDELIGIVVLGRPRARLDVNWEVTDLLKTASRQAASFLAQMHATEALLEARKFDAFNRMSAFVVHDLKNIVTQLSLMMKNAKRLHDNPEFQQDMLMTVENSLEKMRQLMLQLREGEAPPGGSSGVDLTPIARNIGSQASGRGRTVDIDVVDRVLARGHEQRIERVIGHIVQNALDATGAGGRVWMKVDRSSGRARVEVGDTGQGMSTEFVRDRLFKPFNSTKEAGMGIGAYESYQYVRELGGDITVDSRVDRGTTITILLPLFESQQTSDLHVSGAR